ncbi:MULTISPECIES: DUF305 domain-containing protein [Nocardioides]|uniref:DUF305 domain-containing protein n=1 Tax=Nocardioides vastitatis TaxID=2568655 RepID=A0ABW0ZNB2_9ACTN|nr:DUF305 domain-containing protein [Nocardioides sp.]THI98373.1 DUF305 domain-containing protein [Nocardioides sp.]
MDVDLPETTLPAQERVATEDCPTDRGVRDARHDRRVMRTALIAATALLSLAACGGGDATDEESLATETARNGDVYNTADVEFATAMIPLHAEALAMVDVSLDRDLSPEARAVADEVQIEASTEVQEMTAWLTSWDKPIPETVRDHVNAGHGDEHADDHEAASEDLADLEAASGSEFEALWIDLMIENHEEAITVAETQQTAGIFEPAVDLAGSIATAHSDRVDRLAALRAE